MTSTFTLIFIIGLTTPVLKWCELQLREAKWHYQGHSVQCVEWCPRTKPVHILTLAVWDCDFFAHLSKLDLKMRSFCLSRWYKCPYKKHAGERCTERRPWIGGDRLEWCCHKPSKAWSTGNWKRQGEPSPKSLGGVRPCWHLHFWTSGHQNCMRMNFCCVQLLSLWSFVTVTQAI